MAQRAAEDDPVVFIYTTAPTLDVADRIAEAVVTGGHAACANMLPDMRSVYMWEGELKREGEVAVLFKSRRACVGDAMAAIATVHPYDTPAITAFCSADTDPRFAAWVQAQTRRT